MSAPTVDARLAGLLLRGFAPVAPVAAVVMAVGPGKEAVLDTLASVDHYCREPHCVILVDDCTQDGTYEALVSQRRPHWHILRNSCPMGGDRLIHTLSSAYRFVVSQTQCPVVLKIDVDALIIKPRVISDALAYFSEHPNVGIFGAYACGYNGPRSFDGFTKLIATEMSWRNWFEGSRPSWARLLRLAQRKGYQRGDNVFGGAYFVTRACLAAMEGLGALDVPYNWRSQLTQEDVYFSMAAVAAGFKMGHFAAPDGPLCLEWQGLPYPAFELAESKYKVVHSVDKGKNTDRESNGGRTPREIFRDLREKELA